MDLSVAEKPSKLRIINPLYMDQHEILHSILLCGHSILGSPYTFAYLSNDDDDDDGGGGGGDDDNDGCSSITITCICKQIQNTRVY
jgi:hypothetical protein